MWGETTRTSPEELGAQEKERAPYTLKECGKGAEQKTP